MTVSSVEFDLQQGFISNWLVAGPQEIPAGMDLKLDDPGSKQKIARKFYTPKQEFTITPVERGPLDEGIFTIGDYKGEWNYFRCKEDHLVDLSASFQAPTYVRAWAYAHLIWSQESTVQFSLSTYGPVDVWINKKHIFQYEEFPETKASIQFETQITKGTNKILVRFTNFASPDAILAVGVRVYGEAGEGKVHIPTLIPSINRRNQLENFYDQLYLERDIFAHNQPITLHFPESLGEHASIDVRLQTITGRIYGQAEDLGKPGADVKLGTPAMLPLTPFQVIVMPRAWEYYELQIRITRRYPLWPVGRQRFSTNPYGYPEERKREALMFATTVEGSLFAEIAKIALGKWDALEAKLIGQSLANIEQRRSGSEVDFLGFLGMLCRFGEGEGLPGWLVEQLRETALHFHYAEYDFNASTTNAQPAKADREIIFQTCKILAGQLYPEDTFLDLGLFGNQLKEQGEKSALEWMEKRGISGFSCWDSKEIYSNILAALSYLIDLSGKEDVWELASVLMDKMLFTIALNSFNGVYGSSQGQASTTDILSGLLEPTSGITRVMWGMGIFNLHLAGTVSMALMKEYELPPIIAEIAAGLPEEMLNKEQQAAGENPVNKITYRTPNYMLSSAQSYHPGQPGKREHIWQATLGTQSIVFVNHPGSSSENDVHSPNFWLGNGTLPRVGQYKNSLIAIYNLAADEEMDFTHAYFPTIDFDEYSIDGNSAYARKDDGYIALTALNGLDFRTIGPTAFREIRSPGKQNIWICQMGSSTADGSFDEFKKNVLHQEKVSSNLTIEIKNKNGDTLAFGWDTPLLYNGVEQAISNYLHYDNPFTSAALPSKDIEIANSDFRLRLKFGSDTEE